MSGADQIQALSRYGSLHCDLEGGLPFGVPTCRVFFLREQANGNIARRQHRNVIEGAGTNAPSANDAAKAVVGDHGLLAGLQHALAEFEFERCGAAGAVNGIVEAAGLGPAAFFEWL